ncbi:hypothetical protein H0H87_006575 [Tephrocybe sp. NHM501043]|nr:hypothetical protein H0H87_006575 [Tephrocybe sp. NHM501043]
MVRASHTRPYPQRPYTRAYDFESLSPIYFYAQEDFKETLDRLKTKQAKNRTPWDNSQENKAFSSNHDQPERAAFEHGRLLYRIIKKSIDPRKYNLYDVSWAPASQIYSFAFTIRLPDTRSSEERTKSPILLDCGLAQATLPDATDGTSLRYREKSVIHISFYTNRMLSAGSPKLKFKHGETEELDDLATSARLKEFFATTIYQGSSVGSAPVILLIHNALVAMNALRNLGVDTSEWKIGLKDLFEISATQGDYRDDRRIKANSRQYRNNSYHTNDRDNRRGRSRSPARSAPSHRNLSSSSPLIRKVFAPVYVVDIKVLYEALMQSSVASESVASIAGPRGLHLDDSKGCTMVDIWREMISGSSINQQRELRNKNRNCNAQATAVAAPDTPGDDSDVDPRTIRPIALNPTDDDSDYGESDSD